MPGFTELPSEPDVRLSPRPALQFSLIAKYCHLYIRVLHYVLLLYPWQLENLLAFALYAAFPRSVDRSLLLPTTTPAPLPVWFSGSSAIAISGLQTGAIPV